uniref:Olfactory receptor n=1 Tax=Pyxicephalus adspersus TaxID=30357 RepID=A0AAV3AU28_PYXAD|nr:TPA: hypothetical protein GDO54_009916 [Pyxicephalus adspersus]
MLFALFLAIYLVALLGNSLIFSVILINPKLHTPMYFFLCFLSFLDLCISTSIVPRLLYDLLSAHKIISIMACTVQFYVVILLGGTESLLLALMAYDRYLAICHPLHYPIRMRWSMCYELTAFVWMKSFFFYVILPLSAPLALCNPNQINHFICELLAIIQLACDSIYLSKILMTITCFIAFFLPFMLVIVSYICIISSVLKIHSTGRSKAFSTCTSHLMVVVLFYGTSMLMYFGPSTQYATNQGKYLSMFSYIICPALNPIIYSLNNKEPHVLSKLTLQWSDSILPDST